MPDDVQSVRLELTPLPPYTIDEGKQEVEALIAEALREAGQENLLQQQQIQVTKEQTFPTDVVIIVVIKLGAAVAYATYTQIILPKLREYFKVREQGKPTKKDTPDEPQDKGKAG
jgi:hypothetical protein